MLLHDRHLRQVVAGRVPALYDNRSMWRFAGIALVVAGLAIFFRDSVETSTLSPQQRASALSSQLMSPYCPGMTLATCPSSAAGELRSEIERRIAGGESEAEVRDALVYRFGETLRAEPEPRGTGLALWAVPAILGAVMLAMLANGSGLFRRRGREQEPAPVEVDSALLSRLDNELHELG